MKIKNLILIISIFFLVIFLSSCDNQVEPEQLSICGDKICDDLELMEESCPRDCGAEDEDAILTERTEQLLAANRNVDGTLDIEYAEIDGISLLLDLYYPENQVGPLPLIVWIHGGAFKMGSKSQISNLAIINAENDYVVASIDYRLVPDVIFPEPVYDTKAAIRWLRANADEYNIDSDNVGVIGGSAGGYFASMLGTSGGDLEGEVGDDLDYSSTVQAVVNLYGPSDFTMLLEDLGPGSTAVAESGYLGCEILECLDIAEEASPITYVTSDDPPFLILHGDLDPAIPIAQSERFYESLEDAGVESTFITAEGYGHDITIAKVYMPEIIDFFDLHLK